MLAYWIAEQRLAIPGALPPEDVLAPEGWLWSHPRLAGWAAWVRLAGWRWWLPSWAVRDCFCTYPDYLCPCGAYRLIWKEFTRV